MKCSSILQVRWKYLWYLRRKFSYESTGEKKLKIGPHLQKLLSNKWLTFLRHSVDAADLRETFVEDAVMMRDAARTLSAPVITKPPVNQTVTLGDNVTLHCRFHSDIEAYIHWFKLRDDVITDRSSGQSELAIDWNSFAPIQVCY